MSRPFTIESKRAHVRQWIPARPEFIREIEVRDARSGKLYRVTSQNHRFENPLLSFEVFAASRRYCYLNPAQAQTICAELVKAFETAYPQLRGRTVY